VPALSKNFDKQIFVAVGFVCSAHSRLQLKFNKQTAKMAEFSGLPNVCC